MLYLTSVDVDLLSIERMGLCLVEASSEPSLVDVRLSPFRVLNSGSSSMLAQAASEIGGARLEHVPLPTRVSDQPLVDRVILLLQACSSRNR